MKQRSRFEFCGVPVQGPAAAGRPVCGPHVYDALGVYPQAFLVIPSSDPRPVARLLYEAPPLIHRVRAQPAPGAAKMLQGLLGSPQLSRFRSEGAPQGEGGLLAASIRLIAQGRAARGDARIPGPSRRQGAWWRVRQPAISSRMPPPQPRF